MSENEFNELREAISQDHDLLIKIHTSLCGMPGENGGLLGDYKQHKEDNDLFQKEFLKFRRMTLLIFGVLVGSGVLGFGIYELLSKIIS